MEGKNERHLKVGPFEIRVQTEEVPLDEPIPSDAEVEVSIHVARSGPGSEPRNSRHRLEIGFERGMRKPRPAYGTGAGICVAGLTVVLFGAVLKAFGFDLWSGPVLVGAFMVIFFRWRLRDVWPADFPILRRLLGR